MDWQVPIAAYAAILSTVLAAIRVVELWRDRPRLKLAISEGTRAGGLERIEPALVLQVTALNCGTRPIAVAELALGLSTGACIPVPEHLDGTGAKVIPGILGPQEHAAHLLPIGPLRDTLQANGWRVTRLVAHLADGRRPTRGRRQR